MPTEILPRERVHLDDPSRPLRIKTGVCYHVTVPRGVQPLLAMRRPDAQLIPIAETWVQVFAAGEPARSLGVYFTDAVGSIRQPPQQQPEFSIERFLQRGLGLKGLLDIFGFGSAEEQKPDKETPPTPLSIPAKDAYHVEILADATPLDRPAGPPLRLEPGTVDGTRGQVLVLGPSRSELCCDVAIAAERITSARLLATPEEPGAAVCQAPAQCAAHGEHTRCNGVLRGLEPDRAYAIELQLQLDTGTHHHDMGSLAPHASRLDWTPEESA